MNDYGLFYLCKGVFWIADSNCSPVTGSYQANKTEQIGKGPWHIGSMVPPGKFLGSNLGKHTQTHKHTP